MSDNSLVRRSRLTAPVRISPTGKIEHSAAAGTKSRMSTAPLTESVQKRTAVTKSPLEEYQADTSDDGLPAAPLVAVGSSKIAARRDMPELTDAALAQESALTDFFTKEEVAFFDDGDLLSEQDVALEYEPEPPLSTRIRDWLTKGRRKNS